MDTRTKKIEEWVRDMRVAIARVAELIEHLGPYRSSLDVEHAIDKLYGSLDDLREARSIAEERQMYGAEAGARAGQ